MKRDKIIPLIQIGHKHAAAEPKAAESPISMKRWREKFRLLRKRFLWKLHRPFFVLKSRLKRHYQLYLMLKNEEKHILASFVFEKQSRLERESKKVEGLLDTLPRKLTLLRREMERTIPDRSKKYKKFRGQFVKIVREHRRLTREQTCRLLNSHKDFFVRARLHGSYWVFFPFTPDFIEKFEDDTCAVIEEITGAGFLGGIGLPTEDFAEWLSVIYCAEKEFAHFRDWYTELVLREIENMGAGDS